MFSNIHDLSLHRRAHKHLSDHNVKASFFMNPTIAKSWIINLNWI